MGELVGSQERCQLAELRQSSRWKCRRLLVWKPGRQLLWGKSQGRPGGGERPRELDGGAAG